MFVLSILILSPTPQFASHCFSVTAPIDSSIPYSQLQHSVSPPSPTQISRDSPSRVLALDRNSLIAEALYIARPLVHSEKTLLTCVLTAMSA